MGILSRRTTEEDVAAKRSVPATAARRVTGGGLARTVLLAVFLLLAGYFIGALHYRCADSSGSALSKLVEAVGGGAAPAGAPAASQQQLPPEELSNNTTLRFPVCNGFANQRLSVLYGLMIAKRLGRDAVLPVLIDNGLQRTDTSVLATDNNMLAFGDMYDLPHFNAVMQRAGLRLLLPEEVPPLAAYTSVKLASIPGNIIDGLAASHGAVRHLAIDCPLFKLRVGELRPEEGELAWAILNGMRPSKEASAIVDQISLAISNTAARFSQGGARGAAIIADSSSPAQPRFNYIHLRIENDWVEHCKRWESIRDGIVRDNCYRHTDEVDAQLLLFNFSNNIPLYVASFWEDVASERRERVMSRLVSAGYLLVTSDDVFPAAPRNAAAGGGAPADKGGLAGRGREYRAMIEYFVGLRANRFIGNSVSTFAALGLMERRSQGRWAAYYNGGNIPLASVLPLLHRLPWVFTYNSWSPGYDYMTKGAVRSALATRSFQPYCIFMGNTSSDIHDWLVAHNVTIISHDPKWRQQLVDMAAKAQNNVHHSHLFKTPDTLVSTFQRVDLPVVPLLDQYTFVLYTDVDVYFRKPIMLDDFGLPLPRSVSMSYEMDYMFPYNAGVIVANLPTMRQYYNDFIKMMLDNDAGLYYPNYGPADQGIINKFYEKDLRSRMLSQVFNSKPYNVFDPNAFIVHFHGPKPHEYAAFLQDGRCDFKGLCERAFNMALCKYAPEWQQWVPEDPTGALLSNTCTMLGNPVMKRIRGIGRRHLLGSRAAAV